MTEFRENRDAGRPFVVTPDDRVYFPAKIADKARRDTARCLSRGEGVALVFGDAGVGKTLLSRVVASGFGDDDLVAVVSASRKFTVRAFLQQLLYGLHQTFAGGDETELRLLTLDYLDRAPQKKRIILVDDAQNLTLRVFDELRMLVDHTAAPAQLSVALFGTSALEDRLNLPQLYPFAQRVVMRAWLDSFTSDETDRFIVRELKRTNTDAKFTKSAKKAIFDLTEGAPRVVVQLCDRALFLAQERTDDAQEQNTRTLEIDADDVHSAWRDLQSIVETAPDPDAAAIDDVVEFGELDDDDSDEYHESAPTPSSATVSVPETPQEVITAQNPASNSGAATAPATLELVHADGELPTISTGAAAPDVVEKSDADLDAERQARRRAAKEFWDRPETASAPIDAEEEEEIDEPSEIDSELEARLLAKLDAEKKTLDDAAMHFELVDGNGDVYSGASVPRDAVSGATFMRPDDRGSHPRQRVASSAFDEALTLDSAFPPVYESRKSVTRRPILEDGDAAFQSVGAVSVDDTARLSADAGTATDDAATELKDDNESLSLEDRAYRQIVASCYQSSRDFTSSDQYLEELRLLEQEIAEEANLVRRIRRIHLQWRAAADMRGSDAPQEDGSRRFPGSYTIN